MRKDRLNLLYMVNEFYLRLVEILGVFVSFVALLTFFALFSYCAEDQSWNTAIDGIVSNLVSVPGSYYADVMRQALGTASYLFSLLLLSCGLQLMKYHVVVFWRFFLGLLSLPLCDIALAIVKPSFCSVGFVGNIALDTLKKYHIAHPTIVACSLGMVGLFFFHISLSRWF